MANDFRHGTWWNRWSGVPAPTIMEGRFGRLFNPQRVPAASYEPAELAELAEAMTADPESPPTPEGKSDPEENSGIVSAYTYLGQFIDHDLSFDPTSQLRQFVRNLGSLVDFRTPRFDLDSLYGRGPSDQPYMYEPDGLKLALGNPLTGNANDPAARDLAVVLTAALSLATRETMRIAFLRSSMRG